MPTTLYLMSNKLNLIKNHVGEHEHTVGNSCDCKLENVKFTDMDNYLLTNVTEDPHSSIMLTLDRQKQINII